MRAVLALLLILPIAGCDLVFKLPTRQGNVLEQKDLDNLKVGMTREQVKFLLGTPIATSSFTDDRWDYFGYYRPPRGKARSRTVSLWFEGDQLVRMEGEKPLAADPAKPDLEQVDKEEQKAKIEEERAKEPVESGVIITPKKKDDKK